MQLDDQTIELLVRCAWLYYEEGLTQQEIADRLGISRLRVNRLLKQARDTGIVQISIQHPSVRLIELEERLIDHFRLMRAVVIPTPLDRTQLKRVLGKAAATYLERALRPGDCLGVTWGTTLLEVAQQLVPRSVSNLRVVQITGGLTPDVGEINPFDIARRVAEAFDARCYYLYAPMFVSRPEVCEALMNEPFIAHVLEQARSATHVLTSVGEMEPTATFRQVGYLDEATFRSLIGMAPSVPCSPASTTPSANRSRVISIAVRWPSALKTSMPSKTSSSSPVARPRCGRCWAPCGEAT